MPAACWKSKADVVPCTRAVSLPSPSSCRGESQMKRSIFPFQSGKNDVEAARRVVQASDLSDVNWIEAIFRKRYENRGGAARSHGKLFFFFFFKLGDIFCFQN